MTGGLVDNSHLAVGNDRLIPVNNARGRTKSQAHVQ